MVDNEADRVSSTSSREGNRLQLIALPRLPLLGVLKPYLNSAAGLNSPLKSGMVHQILTCRACLDVITEYGVHDASTHLS